MSPSKHAFVQLSCYTAFNRSTSFTLSMILSTED